MYKVFLFKKYFCHCSRRTVVSGKNRFCRHFICQANSCVYIQRFEFAHNMFEVPRRREFKIELLSLNNEKIGKKITALDQRMLHILTIRVLISSV